MPDEYMRELERRAVAGDPGARVHLARARFRAGEDTIDDVFLLHELEPDAGHMARAKDKERTGLVVGDHSLLVYDLEEEPVRVDVGDGMVGSVLSGAGFLFCEADNMSEITAGGIERLPELGDCYVVDGGLLVEMEQSEINNGIMIMDPITSRQMNLFPSLFSSSHVVGQHVNGSPTGIWIESRGDGSCKPLECDQVVRKDDRVYLRRKDSSGVYFVEYGGKAESVRID